jgi:predicted DNA-binding protein YlxM (UPF0122 family)
MAKITKITLDVSNLLNFPETGEILSVSRQAVYDFIRKQKLHPIQIGHNRYFLRNEVEMLKKERRQKFAKN